MFPKAEVLDGMGLIGDRNGEGEVVGRESFLLIELDPELEGCFGFGQFGVSEVGMLLGAVRGDACLDSQVLVEDEGVGFYLAVGGFGIGEFPLVVIGVGKGADQVVRRKYGGYRFEGIGPDMGFLVAVHFEAEGQEFSVFVGGRKGVECAVGGRLVGGFVGVISVGIDLLNLQLVVGELSELGQFFGIAEVFFPCIAEGAQLLGLLGAVGAFEGLRQGDGGKVVKGKGMGVEGAERLEGAGGFEGLVVVVFEVGFEEEQIDVVGLQGESGF